MPTIAEDLAKIAASEAAILDPFDDREESPVGGGSHPQWDLWWALSAGRALEGFGYAPINSGLDESAIHNEHDLQTNGAVVMVERNIAVSDPASAHFEIWANASNQGATKKHGLQLRATRTSTNVFTLKLTWWNEGSEVKSSTLEGVTILQPSGAIAIVIQGKTVEMWYRRETGFEWSLAGGITGYELPEGSDRLVGIGIRGNFALPGPVVYNLRTGELTDPEGETILTLQKSNGVSTASLLPNVPPTPFSDLKSEGKGNAGLSLFGIPILGLEPSFGSSDANLTVKAPTQVLIEGSDGIGGGELILGSLPIIPMGSSPGLGGGTLALSAPTRVTLGSSPGVGSNSILIGTLNTEITSGPTDPTAAKNATFQLTAYEPGCTFEINIDESGWVESSGSNTTEGSKTVGSHTINGVTVGEHTIEVRAKNGAGKVDPTPDSYTWERKAFLIAAGQMYFDVVDNYRLTRSDVSLALAQPEAVFDYTPAETLASSRVGAIVKYIDANNYLWARIENPNVIKIGKVQGGVTTEYSPTTFAFGARSLGTKYRVRFAFEDGKIIIEHGASPALSLIAEYALSAPDLKVFGNEALGKPYIDLTPGHKEWRFDNLSFAASILEEQQIAVVNNRGNHEAKPQIKLAGPMKGPKLVNTDADDELKADITFKEDAEIPAGDIWEIDVEKGTLVDQDGNNMFKELDPTSGWMTLVPGNNHIQLTASGTGSEISGGTEVSSGVSFAYHHSWF